MHTTGICEVCGIEIDAHENMCEVCDIFIKGIEKNNETELAYLRRQLKILKKHNKKVEKERDILIHRILKLDHSYCPQFTEEMTNIPKMHPELIQHCESMGTCHACWYAWVKKEAEECASRICIHCQHRCTVNQKM